MGHTVVSGDRSESLVSAVLYYVGFIWRAVGQSRVPSRTEEGCEMSQGGIHSDCRQETC